MSEQRCRCDDCLTGDALPEHLQGWPGAWQMRFTMPGGRIGQMPTIPDIHDPQLRTACARRCADVGDPPCYELEGNGPVAKPYRHAWCGECLRDCGIEPGDEFDENAAIERLL